MPVNFTRNKCPRRVTGEAKGFVLYSMNERTAKNIASAMLGSPVPLYDHFGRVGPEAMGNIITGQAASRLEHLGYVCQTVPSCSDYR